MRVEKEVAERQALDRVEELLSPARDLAQGDDAVWRGHHFTWRRSDSWTPQLTAWLGPHFRADAMRRLKPGVFRDLCWDDTVWLDVLQRCLKTDIDYLANALAAAIEPTVLRTFHGCRTDDAGVYFREGLKIHDRDAMKARVRAIVEAHEELRWMRGGPLDAAIARIDDPHDAGRVYVVADDIGLLKNGPHYLIYGSEWVMGVLGFGPNHVLKRIGTPTLLEIDLPLRMSSLATRRELADKLLMEWMRLACNRPDWSAPIDFSFCLRTDIPASLVVGHSHPAELEDHHDHYSVYRTRDPTCKHCRRNQGTASS